jgi:rhodanese-related sulfurtransferase
MNTESLVPEVTIETLQQWLQAGTVLLIDVREQNEWNEAHLEQAHLLPLSTFDPAQVPAAGDRHTVIMCRSGRRSADATRLMQLSGRKDVYNLEGGILAWHAASLPMLTGA